MAWQFVYWLMGRRLHLRMKSAARGEIVEISCYRFSTLLKRRRYYRSIGFR